MIIKSHQQPLLHHLSVHASIGLYALLHHLSVHASISQNRTMLKDLKTNSFCKCISMETWLRGGRRGGRRGGMRGGRRGGRRGGTLCFAKLHIHDIVSMCVCVLSRMMWLWEL